MRLLEPSWQRAWRAIGAADDGDALMQELLDRYRQPHRKYHTLQHLAECISIFAPAREVAIRPAEIEIALWFHDAVYDIGRGDNEQRSAAFAKEAALAAGALPAAAERIHDLVLSTRHDALPQPGDHALLVDVDLSILGAPAARFDQYEVQIREEYESVADEPFRSRRREILRRFLARPAIYGTAHFRSALEDSARDNLRRSIARLGG